MLNEEIFNFNIMNLDFPSNEKKNSVNKFQNYIKNQEETYNLINNKTKENNYNTLKDNYSYNKNSYNQSDLKSKCNYDEEKEEKNQKDEIYDKNFKEFMDSQTQIKNNKIDKSTIDDYLDSIGYNIFHFFMILIVCYVFFVDGSEMIIVNLILSSIQRDWKITNFKRSILSSAVFFGFFLGSFISGYLSNRYGRKNPSIFGVFLIWIFTTLTPFTINFSSLFAVRFFVGIGIGFVVSSLTSLITEMIPTYYRSFVLNILWVFYPFGIIYICVLSIFYIKDQEFLDWKKITLINSYSSIIMVIISFMLCESPRYLLLKGRYEEAFKILDRLGKASNRSLSDSDKEKIILESKLIEEQNKNKNDFDIYVFYDKRFFKVSILVGYLWFIASLVSYGLLYILPKLFDTLSKNNKYNSLLHMIYSMMVLTLCPFFRGVISEIKILGRKNSIIIGFTGAGIACLFCIYNQTYISLTSGLLKFFINTSLGIVSVFTSEIYPTNVRGIALGFGNSITRLAGIFTPFICEYFEKLVPRGPFWLFIFGSISGIIATLVLPYETIGMVLDKIPPNIMFNEKEKEEESIYKEKKNLIFN